MRRLNIIIIAGFAACAVGFAHSASAQAPASEIVAFEGARIIVGDDRAPIDNATLVVDGATIQQVGKASDVRIPAGATRVNVGGKTIMPALIDTHVHTNQTSEALAQDLRRLAYFGVGTVMSLGVDTSDAAFEARARPLPGSARILTAGRGITAPEPGREAAPIWVTTEAEARKAVQENALRGVDIIKVWVDDRNGKYKKLTPDLYAAVIDEAHQRKLPVTAHIYALDDAKGLLRAGVDAFAHSVRDRDVDEEFISLLQQHPSVVLNPNLASRGVPTDLSWLRDSLPKEQFAKLEARNIDQPKAQAAYAIQARNLIKMRDAGISIVLGTDTSFDFADGNTPWASHIEMEDMVAAGMTPMQVILAATHNAAEFLGLSDVGTLEAGKSADFIVLNASPLDSVTNTRRIASVYLRGFPVDRETYH